MLNKDFIEEQVQTAIMSQLIHGDYGSNLLSITIRKKKRTEQMQLKKKQDTKYLKIVYTDARGIKPKKKKKKNLKTFKLKHFDIFFQS